MDQYKNSISGVKIPFSVVWVIRTSIDSVVADVFKNISEGMDKESITVKGMCCFL